MPTMPRLVRSEPRRGPRGDCRRRRSTRRRGMLSPRSPRRCRAGPRRPQADGREAAGAASATPARPSWTLLCEALLTKDGKPRRSRVRPRRWPSWRPRRLIETAEALAEQLADGARCGWPRSRRAAAHAGAAPFRRALLRRLCGGARRQRGLLDFDDLIARALALLRTIRRWRNGCCSGWTAASTISWSTRRRTPAPRNGRSSSCWRRSSPPAQGARAGASGRCSSVGDQKQSIYSFQGADPARVRADAGAFSPSGWQAPGSRLQDWQLRHSFRSSPLILRLVDRVFDPAGATSGGAEPTQHLAFRAGDAGAGRPLAAARSREAEPDCRTGTIRSTGAAQAHHGVELASRIAGEIARMIDAASRCPTRRAAPAGDRRRHPDPGARRRSFISRRSDPGLQGARAAGCRGGPAEAGAELAVQDLMALLTFCHARGRPVARRGPALAAVRLERGRALRAGTAARHGRSLGGLRSGRGRHRQALAILHGPAATGGFPAALRADRTDPDPPWRPPAAAGAAGRRGGGRRSTSCCRRRWPMRDARCRA